MLNVARTLPRLKCKAHQVSGHHPQTPAPATKRKTTLSAEKSLYLTQVEQELSRRTKPDRNDTPMKSDNKQRGLMTVASLRPAAAIIILETARIIQAAQLMAAKRTDAVLAVNEHGALVGILTDKDIAYRVVAEGLDIRTTQVMSVMTKNPISVLDTSNRNDSLNMMVLRKFRHLPVISDESACNQEVTGLLDITKCVFERLDDLEKRVNDDKSIISAMEVLQRRGNIDADKAGAVRDQHGCPNVGSVLLNANAARNSDHSPGISIKATVREAARAMRSQHSTAVLVLGATQGDVISGIFTTKDIVLRVIAASLDPLTTSVVRVMVLF